MCTGQQAAAAAAASATAVVGVDAAAERPSALPTATTSTVFVPITSDMNTTTFLGYDDHSGGEGNSNVSPN